MSELSNAGRVSLVLKGDWANNVAYTRLDMVTHDGHLYGAKKDAPAGTPLTNTVYWADFGAFSIPVATIFEAGKVKPDGVSITVDADGTIHSVATGSANLVEIDQEDYDELPETEKMDETKAYYIPNSDDDDVIEIDGEMSDISENAIANRIVKFYIDSKLVFTTWEAYKALPDTKYSDGKIYIITDVNENSESNIARGYSSVSSYNKGDAVIYDNTLYRCLVDITTPEAFNLNHWERFYVADLNSNLTELDGRVTVLENRSFSWTLLGNVTGSTPITLPEQYSELHIYVERADGKAKITGNIIAEDVADSTDSAYVFGGVNGTSLGSNQCAGLKINNGTIWLFRYTDGSTETTSTAKLKVYTR